MSGLRARVHNGRIVVDEKTDLPEGTVLDLVVDDEGDDMDDADRAALGASIARALDAVRARKVRPAADVVAELRAQAVKLPVVVAEPAEARGSGPPISALALPT